MILILITPFMSSKSRYAPILHTCCNHLLQDKMKFRPLFLNAFCPISSQLYLPAARDD